MTLPILTALPNERRGYVDGSDGQVHYRSHGVGPPILLVHQAPWSSIQFHRALPLLAKSGFRAVAVDLPGHGMSSPPAQPSIESYADSLAAVITRLVLDNAPFLSASDRAQRIGRFPDQQEIAPNGSHLTDRWAWVRRVGDPEWSDETVHISVITYFQHGPWKEHGHKSIPLFDFELHVPRIKAPTLVIGSRRDPVFPSAELLLKARRDWDYVELPGGPGMVLDRAEEWWAALVPFLKS
jgi:pimeloyl-ACP methyl ester carboxylesterase